MRGGPRPRLRTSIPFVQSHPPPLVTITKHLPTTINIHSVRYRRPYRYVRLALLQVTDRSFRTTNPRQARPNPRQPRAAQGRQVKVHQVAGCGHILRQAHRTSPCPQRDSDIQTGRTESMYVFAANQNRSYCRVHFSHGAGYAANFDLSVDSVLDDCLQLISLFFLTIGRNAEAPAA